METLKLDRKTAINLYPTASAEFKKMLEETFGDKTFKGNVIDRVQTMEDAYRETGKSLAKILIDNCPDAYKKAEAEIEIFAEALREGKPAGECCYYPYFNRSSGGGFSYVGCADGRVCSIVGARLRVDTPEKANHLGQKMIDRYKIMDKG